MNPQRLLRRMCRRHRLPYREAHRLLPLVQRALNSPNSPRSVRDRLLVLVEGNLSVRSESPKTGEPYLFLDLDHEVLLSVAGVLQTWEPSGQVLELGGILSRLFPDGLGPQDLAGREDEEDGEEAE